jgi:hypothetical protein
VTGHILSTERTGWKILKSTKAVGIVPRRKNTVGDMVQRRTKGRIQSNYYINEQVDVGKIGLSLFSYTQKDVNLWPFLDLPMSFVTIKEFKFIIKSSRSKPFYIAV